MRVFRLALTACTLCVLADTAPVIAQDADRPDFVGTWILDLDASSFGPSPAPDSARIVVERADEHVVMTRISYVNGENTVRFDMPADGEVHQATTDDGSTDATAEWSGRSFTVWLVAQANVGDVDVTELWGIDSESGRLGIDRTIDVPGYGVFEQTLLYSKERE
jgi:hypothetical protein